MSCSRPRGVASRIKGRPAITRSLAGLLIRTHRFGRLRAQTDDDRRWAARVIDALDVALRTARGERLDAFDKEVHDEPEF